MGAVGQNADPCVAVCGEGGGACMALRCAICVALRCALLRFGLLPCYARDCIYISPCTMRCIYAALYMELLCPEMRCADSPCIALYCAVSPSSVLCCPASPHAGLRCAATLHSAAECRATLHFAVPGDAAWQHSVAQLKGALTALCSIALHSAAL
jgi:hypothetical protein